MKLDNMKLDNMKENNMKLIARSIVLTLVLALTFSTAMLGPTASAASEKYRSSADDSYIEQPCQVIISGRLSAPSPLTAEWSQYCAMTCWPFSKMGRGLILERLVQQRMIS